MLKIKIPATSANLGPGFDCLAISLNLYNNFKIELRNSFKIKYSGLADYNEVFNSENNLIIKSYKNICKKKNWPIKPFLLNGDINIPYESGLGSSATAVISGVIAAYYFNNKSINKIQLLNESYDIEPHPDNITAAIFGGLTTAFKTKKKIIFNSTNIDYDLNCLIIHPDTKVNTETSRLNIPKTVKLESAVANIARASMLCCALSNKKYKLLNECMNDFIHQSYRINPIFKLEELKTKLISKDYYGIALSGSGPALLVLCNNNNNNLKIEQIIKNHFQNLNIKTRIYNLQVDNKGLECNYILN